MKNTTNIITILSVLVVLASVNLYQTVYGGVSKVVHVSISESGFNPESITVTPGTVVVWTNTGSRQHWPASNDHPTHGAYPDSGGCIGSKFDACKGLQTGEEYSFELDSVGVWGVHDHLFPGLTMTVRVVSQKSLFGKLEPTKNSNQKEVGFLADDHDLQTGTIREMAQKDPAKAWQYVKDSFIVNGQVVGNAHEFAHLIGNEAYRKYGLDGIKICDDSFAFGCFHGVTEEMLLTKGVTEVKKIQERCIEIFPPAKSQDYTGCIHGTGHGIYGWEGGNLKKSLVDCDIIDQSYRQYCYDGVFMENSSSPSAKVFDKNNPWKLCSDLDERYHRNCARYQSQIFLGGVGTDGLNQVGKYCATGPTKLLKDTCFESLGYYVAQNALGGIDNIKINCGKMPTNDGVEICLKGSATESVFQKYKNGVETAKTICSMLSEPLRSACSVGINNMTDSSAH